MKTIIAGSRGISNYELVCAAISGSNFEITQVISGTAPGVDRLGEKWAEENGIPVDRMPADWFTHGKRAGYIRNHDMACKADALIAIWDGVSKGTANMIQTANKKGLMVLAVRVPEEEERNG